jgi:hypothetical protein
MPPAGKSDGSLIVISAVWVAGSPLSVLRRSDQVTASLRSGTSISARMASSGGCPSAAVTISVRAVAVVRMTVTTLTSSRAGSEELNPAGFFGAYLINVAHPASACSPMRSRRGSSDGRDQDNVRASTS